MPASVNALALIKPFETCILTAFPDAESELGQACVHFSLPLTDYQKVPRWQLLKADPVTIGWGRAHGVRLGDSITQEQADLFLAQDVAEAELPLAGLALNQNQFDALVSFVYNVGAEEFEHGGPAGGPSHILTYLQNGDFPAAANEFPKWDHAHGQVVPGLLRRRLAEQALFVTPVQEGAA